MRNIVLILSLSIFIFGCTKDQSSGDIMSQFSNPREVQVIDSTLLSRDVFKIGQMEMFGDWLIMTNYSSDTYLYAYNIESGREINFLHEGRAIYEAGHVSSICKLNDSTLWVDCDMPAKALIYDINDIFSENVKPKKSYDLIKSPFNNSILSNNTLIYPATNLSNNTTMYFAQTVEGDTIKFFGEYPLEDEGLVKIPDKDYSRATTYQGQIFKHPSKDLACFVPIYALGFDLIDTKKIAIKKRVFYHYPIMEVIHMFEANFVKPTKENVGGFDGTYCNNKFIYQTISEKNSATNTEDQYLLVYDWDGSPVRSFKLPVYTSCFVVSEDNKTLYALYKDKEDYNRICLYKYRLL